MTDRHEDLVERAGETLRGESGPPGMEERISRRVMAGIRDGAQRRRPRTAALRLGALAAGASAAAMMLWWLAGAGAGAGPDQTEPAPGATRHRFALVAPRATSVAVVGDFNDWDPQASRLRSGRNGTWTLELALPPGSHRYAFVVDGTHWLPDPASGATIADDFGDGNSIVTIVGRS
jgi:hypothetical protein